MHAFGANEFLIERTATSSTLEAICEVYLGAPYHCGYVDVFTDALIQGIDSAGVKSEIAFRRAGGAGLLTPAVTQIWAHGGGSPAHTAVISGNNVLIKFSFAATGSGSVLRHHVRTFGSVVTLKKY